MSDRTLSHRVATWILVAVIAATLLRTWDRLRAPPEPPAVPEAVERPHLRKWAIPGCYALRVEPWAWSPTPPDTARASAAPDSIGVPPFLVPPTRVRLIADSTDQWRRSRVSYRAVPLTGDHDPRAADYMRWVVRADTLWLLWSDGRAGGGVALRQVGDSLLGRARAFDRVRELDGQAAAAAWRIDCRTLEREPAERRPRR